MSSNNGHTNGDNKRGKYREYSTEDRLAALAALEANKGNAYKTAQLLDIPIQTLNSWKQDALSADSVEVRQHKKSLADKFEDLAHKLVDVAPDFILADKTTLSMVATAAGIATDKAQLLRGQPTQIIDDPARVSAAIERVINLTGCDREIAEASVRATPEFRDLGKVG
jgi:transposase-like protein